METFFNIRFEPSERLSLTTPSFVTVAQFPLF